MPDKTVRRRWRLQRKQWPLIALLLLAGALSFLVRDFFRQMIFLPMLEFGFILYRIYRSAPQRFVWAAFIVVALLMAGRALWRAPQLPPRRRRDAPFVGRVDQLAAWVAQAPTVGYHRWQLAQALARVAWAALERERGESAETLHSRLTNGSLTLDPQLRALLTACAATPSYRDYVEQQERSTPHPNAIDALNLAEMLQAVTHVAGLANGGPTSEAA